MTDQFREISLKLDHNLGPRSPSLTHRKLAHAYSLQLLCIYDITNFKQSCNISKFDRSTPLRLRPSAKAWL